MRVGIAGLARNRGRAIWGGNITGTESAAVRQVIVIIVPVYSFLGCKVISKRGTSPETGLNAQGIGAGEKPHNAFSSLFHAKNSVLESIQRPQADRG